MEAGGWVPAGSSRPPAEVDGWQPAAGEPQQRDQPGSRPVESPRSDPQPTDNPPSAGSGRLGWLGSRRELTAARTDPRAAGVAALALVAVVAALIAGVALLRARPQPVLAPPTSGIAAPMTAGSPAASLPPVGTATAQPAASTGTVVVDVAGKVRRPGLVRLPAGSRVADAVDAAGGPLSGVDTSLLNLAQPVTDGQQVLVGVAPAPGQGAASAGAAGGASASPGGSAAGARVDLNTATAGQLESLPGVGPVLAQRIVDWRNQHGRFAGVQQLRDVSGIGDKIFSGLKDLVTVS